MRKLPPLTRKREYFARRYVITLPPWGPFVIGAAIFGAVLIRATLLATAFCMIMAGLSAVFCMVAWRQLKEMRYALHNAINDIESEEYEPEGLEGLVLDEPTYEVPIA